MKMGLIHHHNPLKEVKQSTASICWDFRHIGVDLVSLEEICEIAKFKGRWAICIQVKSVREGSVFLKSLVAERGAILFEEGAPGSSTSFGSRMVQLEKVLPTSLDYLRGCTAEWSFRNWSWSPSTLHWQYCREICRISVFVLADSTESGIWILHVNLSCRSMILRNDAWAGRSRWQRNYSRYPFLTVQIGRVPWFGATTILFSPSINNLSWEDTFRPLSSSLTLRRRQISSLSFWCT